MRERVADFPDNYGDSPKAVAFRNFITMSSAVGVVYREALRQWTKARKFDRLPRLYRKRKHHYDRHCRNMSHVTIVGFGVAKDPEQDPTVDHHVGEHLDDREHGNLNDPSPRLEFVREALRELEFTELMVERSLSNLRDLETPFNSATGLYIALCEKFNELSMMSRVWKASRERNTNSGLAGSVKSAIRMMEEMAHALHTGALSTKEYETHRTATLKQVGDASARLKKRNRQKVQEAIDLMSGMRDVTHMGMSASCELGSWTECRDTIERDSEELDRGPIATADLLKISAVIEFEGSATLASLVACLRRPEGEVELSVLLHALLMRYLPVAVFTTARCPGN